MTFTYEGYHKFCSFTNILYSLKVLHHPMFLTSYNTNHDYNMHITYVVTLLR